MTIWLDGTARELTRVADFAGLPATPEAISQAVERRPAEKIRKMVKPGGWRSDLPEPQLARIEAAWGDIMACLGYQLVTRDSRAALKSGLLGLLVAGAAGRTGEPMEMVFAGDTSAVPGSLPTRTMIR